MNHAQMWHCTHTEPGGKDVNEDCLLMRAHPQDSAVWIVCIADGQGGRAHGAAAAQMACQSYYEKAAACSLADLFRASVQQELFRYVDDRVSQTGGFTTFVAAVVEREFLIGGSSGDSKVYAVQGQAELEELTLSQHKNPPVGSGGAMFETFSRPLLPGHRLLMVTDGVWKYAGYENLKNALKSGSFPWVADELRTATLARCGTSLPDDFSLVGIAL